MYQHPISLVLPPSLSTASSPVSSREVTSVEYMLCIFRMSITLPLPPLANFHSRMGL